MDGSRIQTAFLSPDEAPAELACAGDRPGDGLLEIARVGGRSGVVHSSARSPLKLLVPSRGMGDAVSVYATTFGGGLVEGDRIQLRLDAGPDTTTFLTTQSATKVYRSPRGIGAAQSLFATLAAGTTLVVWPDPIICFEDARYRQRQEFRLDRDASLVLVDWQTSGRRARGERWAFSRYESRNVVEIAGELAINDVLLFDREDGELNGTFRAGRFECFASIILLGSAVASFAESLHMQINSQQPNFRTTPICSCGRLGEAMILRLADQDPEGLSKYLRKALEPLMASLLGHDPWSRKW
jgi:urease accessory protein